MFSNKMKSLAHWPHTVMHHYSLSLLLKSASSSVTRTIIWIFNLCPHFHSPTFVFPFCFTLNYLYQFTKLIFYFPKKLTLCQHDQIIEVALYCLFKTWHSICSQFEILKCSYFGWNDFSYWWRGTITRHLGQINHLCLINFVSLK